MTKYDESILRSLRRIMRAIDVYSRHLASVHNLTGPQLVCLRELEKAGAMAPSTLATSISLSHPTVTGILDRLEKRELVTRTRLTSDKRRVLVELTPEGAHLAEVAPLPLQHHFAQRLSALPKEEQARIDEVLGLVVKMMEAEALGAAPVLTAGPIDVSAAEVAEFLQAGNGKPQE